MYKSYQGFEFQLIRLDEIRIFLKAFSKDRDLNQGKLIQEKNLESVHQKKDERELSSCMKETTMF